MSIIPVERNTSIGMNDSSSVSSQPSKAAMNDLKSTLGLVIDRMDGTNFSVGTSKLSKEEYEGFIGVGSALNGGKPIIV